MSRPERGAGDLVPDALSAEVARLSDLPINDLRARWRTVFRRVPPPTLSRNLLFRTLAYRLQADRYGDLDAESRRILDSVNLDSADETLKSVMSSGLKRRDRKLQPGTVVSREWKGQMHRVTITGDGFSWDGKTYKSLTQIAYAITGTRWNGPRFFGFRNKSARETET
jgi:hypothetical protein